MNKFLLVIIGGVLLLWLIDRTTADEGVTITAERYVLVSEIIAVIMMLVNGTFMSTVWFKVALFFIGLTVLGYIFKIMHLNGAVELSTIPLAGVFILYLVHFFKKQPKNRVDFMKVLMLFSSLALPPIIILHLASESEQQTFFLVNHVLLWSTFLDFLYTGRKEGILTK